MGRFLSPDPFVQSPEFSQNFNRYSYCLNNPLKYNDPDGELVWLLPALIGGVINVATNWEQIDNFGHGLSMFATGAFAGVAATFCPQSIPYISGALGGANSILNQGFTQGWNNIDFSRTFDDALFGVATSVIGGQLSSKIAPHLNGVLSQISSPVLQQMALQGATGSAVGFTINAGMTFVSGGDLSEAMKQGIKGSVMGLGIGLLNGLGTGLKMAKEQGVNPWNGKELAAKGGLAEARALGIAGEEAVGVGAKTRIPSLTGTAKYRIPDQLTSTTLGEVKNVSNLSLTRQLTDFHLYSQQTGRQFILYTRPTTTFSGPLQNLINNGSVIVKPIPFR